MKRTSNSTTYFAILTFFCIAFFICMELIYSKYQHLTERYAYTSTSNRLEWLEMKTSMGSLSNVAQNLTMDYDYGPEFDAYWNFSEMEGYFMQGMSLKRAVNEGDTSKKAQLDACIQFVQNYIEDPANADFKALAEKNLDELTQSH